MGKVPATYRARITFLINICMEIEAKEGYIDVHKLAEETGLTERAIRDYINDLLTLGILNYAGTGKYTVNKEWVNEVLKEVALGPYIQLKLDDFINPGYIQTVLGAKTLENKVKRIFKKLNLELAFSGEIREKVRKTKIDGRYGPLIGEKLIYEKSARNIALDDIYVPGSASCRNINNYGAHYFAVLSVVYLSAGCYIGYYEKNILNQYRSDSRVVPELISFRGKEPFLPGEPFYELSTDFPELLHVGRSIAARYLEEILHYQLDIKTIEEHGDKFDIYFRMGTLVPHGFVVKAKKLVLIRDKCHELFYKLVGEAKKRKILVVGVTAFPTDNIFLKHAERLLKFKVAETNDMNFLLNILDDGDTTCLIEREREKGRPPVEDWYEFYLKYRNYIVRFDFISQKDPWEEYEKIRDLAYSSAIVPPAPGIPPGPGIVSTAQALAYSNLGQLRRSIEGVLKAVFQDYVQQLQEERDEKRWERIKNGEEE